MAQNSLGEGGWKEESQYLLVLGVETIKVLFSKPAFPRRVVGSPLADLQLAQACWSPLKLLSISIAEERNSGSLNLNIWFSDKIMFLNFERQCSHCAVGTAPDFTLKYLAFILLTFFTGSFGFVYCTPICLLIQFPNGFFNATPHTYSQLIHEKITPSTRSPPAIWTRPPPQSDKTSFLIICNSLGAFFFTFLLFTLQSRDNFITLMSR